MKKPKKGKKAKAIVVPNYFETSQKKWAKFFKQFCKLQLKKRFFEHT